MYQPNEGIKKHLCKDWQLVPRGHEFLSVPISLLSRIKEHGWREGEVDAESSNIASGIWWRPHDHMSALCHPNCKHDFGNRVQTLSKKGKGTDDSTCKFIPNAIMGCRS